MGMLSLKSLRYSAAIVAALVLTACGGGGGGASDTDITEADAYEGVSLAKSAELLLREQVIGSTEFVESLALFTGVGIASTGSAYSTPVVIYCATSGSMSTSYKKTTLKSGLTLGDSVKTVFSNCVGSGYKMTGTVVLTALTSTSVDVSSTTTSIELPMSIEYQTVTNEPVVTGGYKETYTGTLKYTTLNYQFPVSSEGVLENSSFTYKYQDFTDGYVLTVSYGALSGNATINTTTGAVMGDFTANVAASLTGSQSDSASMTLEASTSAPGTILQATAATYTITNYQGGKVVGTLPSGGTVITIDVDNGNNGSIENTYTGLFADF